MAALYAKGYMKALSFFYYLVFVFCITYVPVLFFATDLSNLINSDFDVAMLIYYLGMWSLWFIPIVSISFAFRDLRSKIIHEVGRRMTITIFISTILFELWGLTMFYLAMTSI